MKVHIEWTPFPQQVKAHQAWQKHILYGGATAGGKSAWLTNDAVRQSLAYQNNRVGIFRWELANFKKTTFNTVEQWVLGIPGLVAKHNQAAGESCITLLNGSRIVYGGLRPTSTVAGDILSVIKSLELNAIYIDEVSDVPEKVFDFSATRVPRWKCLSNRTGRLEYPKPRIACTSNPHLGWVKQRFIDQTLRDYIFISSKVSDNRHVDPDYEPSIRRAWAGKPDWIKQFLDGDWTAAVDWAAIVIAPWIEAARKRHVEPGLPVEFGVDIAAGGRDKTVVIRRRGNVPDIILAEQGLPDTMMTVSKIAALADKYHPVAIKIDAIGVGKGPFDRLAELGYPVIAMIGGAVPEDEAYANARAEWYWNLRTMLENGEMSLPDTQELLNELGQIQFSQSASDRTIRVESKADILKRLGHSPDYADALAYAMAGAGSGGGVLSGLAG